MLAYMKKSWNGISCLNVSYSLDPVNQIHSRINQVTKELKASKELIMGL